MKALAAPLVGISLLLAAAPVSSDAQRAAEGVVTESVVSSDLPDTPHIEPRLAMNPKNPSHFLVVSIVFQRDDGEGVCSSSVSLDAGVTWRRGRFTSETPALPGGDPWVAFDPDGTAYLSCMHGVRTETGERSSKIGVYRSTDGGLSWSEPAFVPGYAFDRPVIVVGEAKPYPVYVVASQSITTETGRMYPVSVATSTDGGRTFGAPAHILPNNLNNNVRAAVALADGTLLILFYDIGGPDGRPFEKFRIWASPARSDQIANAPVLFVNENDGGDTVDVVVDRKRGRTFTVWDVVRGNQKGVYFARSDDGGRTWTKPARIVEPGQGVKQQHVPTVATSPTGTLGTLWIDYRNDARGECYEAYFRGSRDDGQTWLPAVNLSAQPSCPKTPRNVVRRADGKPRDLSRRWSEGGDYHGLVAGPDGRYHAVWADSRTGVFQLRFASIDVTTR